MSVSMVCLRNDDIHARVPARTLYELDSHVWGNRPVTLGAIPLVGWDCFRRDLFEFEEDVPRRSLWEASEVMDYLDDGVRTGRVEVALHGMDHTDLSVAGRVTAELEAPSPQRTALLWRFLRVLGEKFGTRTVIPPHNFMSDELADSCLTNGYHLSRSIPDWLIADLGLDTSRKAARNEAKRRAPFRVVGSAVDLYQTLMISRRRIERQKLSAVSLADEIVATTASSGIATITFHWWDYYDPGLVLSESFCDFTRELLANVERRLSPRYCTISQAAEEILSTAARCTVSS